MRKYALTYAKDRKKTRVRLPKGVRVKQTGTYEGFKVFTVDGTLLRLKIDIDFTMGGTGARYAFIPMNEIWVEQNLNGTDATATLYHEYVEFVEMTENGLSYNDAHDIASVKELDLRKSISKMEKHEGLVVVLK